MATPTRAQGVCLLAVLLFCQDVSAGETNHFKQWFPQYGRGFATMLQQNCSSEYADYLNSSSPACAQGDLTCVTSQVIDCLLNITRESWKSNMSAAAVLLGIMPTTLSLVGSTTVETGLLAMRRPLLSFLLSAGSPAVFPIRTFEYRSPEELLRSRDDDVAIPRFSPPVSAAIVVLQYILACGAVANIAEVTYELCRFSVCSFSSQLHSLPAIWVCLGLAVHFFGTIGVWLRMQLEESHEKPRTPRAILSQEFLLNSRWSAATLSFRRETYFFTFMSWFASTTNVLHIIFGTVVFSSLLFIGCADAVTISLRCLASAMVCRVILMFEISGMRRTACFRDESDTTNGDAKGTSSGRELAPQRNIQAHHSTQHHVLR
ncbi:hypothetical protein GQ53DRAFT_867037 [Thozetella sp. PMI_491]|nr:hypothetical protein GQ53DRAFT_867037 [Thozetella sp. PMI_491]